MSQYHPIIASTLLGLSLTLGLMPGSSAQQPPPAEAEKVELFLPLDRPLPEAIARMGGILSALGGRVREDRLTPDRLLIASHWTPTRFVWEVTAIDAAHAQGPGGHLRLFCATREEPVQAFCGRIRQIYESTKE